MAARQPLGKDGGRKNCQDAKHGPRRNNLNRYCSNVSGAFGGRAVSKKRDPWALRPRLTAGVP
jgi:hypothetical protein